jgi:hypothetical protein
MADPIAPATFSQLITEGLVRGNDATITIDGSAAGLVQEWQLQWDRRLVRQYEVFKTDTVVEGQNMAFVKYLEGIPNGLLVLNSVAGPLNLPQQACECVPHTIELVPGDMYCNGFEVSKYTLTQALPVRFTMRGSLTPELVLFNVTYTFVDIEETNNG